MLLIDDGVQNNGGFAGLAVADYQLALAAADRNQRIDDFKAGLHRFVHAFPRNDTRSLHFGIAELLRLYRAFAVNRLAKRVDDAAKQFLTDRDAYDFVGALDGVAFLNLLVGTENNDADIVFLKVKSHSLNAGFKLDHFVSLNLI